MIHDPRHLLDRLLYELAVRSMLMGLRAGAAVAGVLARVSNYYCRSTTGEGG